MEVENLFQWFQREFPESAISTLLAGVICVITTLILTKSIDQFISFFGQLFGARQKMRNQELVTQIVNAINNPEDKNSLGYKIEQICVKLDQTNTRIDQTNTRIDQTNTRIDQTNTRIDELNNPRCKGSLANQIQNMQDPNSAGSLANQIQNMQDPNSAGSLANQIQNMQDPYHTGSLAYQMKVGFESVDSRLDEDNSILQDHELRISKNELRIDERIPRQPLV